MRFDLVLAGLRLFKSRTQAQAAITSGAVLLNGRAAKPSDDVRAGDLVRLAGTRGARTVEVLEMPRRSLSHEAARALVREIEE